MASWNVEGLNTDTKLEQILRHMWELDIGLLALQETHRTGSEYFIHNGFLVVLSGSETEGREYRGVGFIVAPWLRHAVQSFTQCNERLAKIRIRVVGGLACFISAYAPHNGYDLSVRADFFHDLAGLVTTSNTPGPTYVLGDLNARVQLRRPGEEDALGLHMFSGAAALPAAHSNRELFLELCTSCGYVVANTFFARPVEQIVTYFELSAKPMDVVTDNAFAELDHVLVHNSWLHTVQSVCSDRRVALQSHHFILLIQLEIGIEKKEKRQRPERFDLSCLLRQPVVCEFSRAFVEAAALENAMADEDLNIRAEATARCMRSAAQASIPKLAATPRRPWIRTHTLETIELRNQARRNEQYGLEKSLNKMIKNLARADRKHWLEQQLVSNDWAAIKRMRKGRHRSQGRLQDLTGNLVQSSERAETLADYYEQVQWGAGAAIDSSMGEHPRHEFGSPLDINLGEITELELQRVIGRLRRQKSPGPDDIPAEMWIALASDSAALNILLELCNEIWMRRQIPTQWKHATVVALFKAGNTALPGNYRPISLLTVGYKVVARLLLDRLRAGGVEARLRASQFGFRAGRSTQDAIFMAKRIVETTLAERDGKSSMIFLDWSRAFDKVMPDAMLRALGRFGLPEAIVEMVASIYESRSFCTRDAGIMSSERQQSRGIAQGCPLSPYLFIIVLTVIFADADLATGNCPRLFLDHDASTLDVTYADDTLLVSSDPGLLQRYLCSLMEVASTYGLTPNLAKTKHMRIGHVEDVTASGVALEVVQQAVYLGSLITSCGSSAPSLMRRLGEARGTFDKLSAVWKHANMARQRKILLYKSCIVSKLTYSLECETLRAADYSRLDAFHCRCLRKILGIQHSMISRVTNAAVLSQAGLLPLSITIKERQLLLYGRVAMMPADSYVRRSALKPYSILPKQTGFNRKRGRPRLAWSTVAHAMAVKICNESQQALNDFLPGVGGNFPAWRRLVEEQVKLL